MSTPHHLQAKIALTLFAIAIFAISLPIQAQKNYHPVKIIQIHANPINIAARLVLQQDSAKIASTLEYYGYTPVNSNSQSASRKTQNAEDGFSVFTHPDGTIILFSFPDSETNPTVQVHSKTNRPKTEKILEELDYKKNGDHFENIMSKYSKYLKKCTFGPNNSVTFQRQKK